jgi:putative ABC transport system substrate-binding protein
MRRREFIVLLAGVIARWSLAAGAQQVATPRVGYIWIGSNSAEDPGYAGLRRGLMDRGYIVGKTLAFEERYAEGHTDRLLSSPNFSLSISMFS